MSLYKRSGLSAIELLVVIAILGMLAALLLPALQSSRVLMISLPFKS